MEPLQPSDPTNIGRYRITGRLGAGGMGSVYLGLSPGGRPAAVKIIHENFQRDPDSLARFRREVETLRTVRSAYTAALIDSEVDHAPYWLATEYVPGPTLHASVVDNGPFSTTACFGMFAALAEGLTDIHEHGVCHRDLKPQNVILAATGPQLIDFGIARGAEQTGITQVGHAVGTPGYTAPEVLTHNQVGPAADVFALGVMIGFVATGRPPFGSGTFTAVSMRILDAKIDLGGVDPGLAGLIRSCVAADPAARPTPEAIIEACHRLSPSRQAGPTMPNGAVAGRTSLMPAARPGPGTAGQPGQGMTGQPGQGTAGQGMAGQPGQGMAGQPGQGMGGQPGPGMVGQPGRGTASRPVPGRPVSGAAQVPGQVSGAAAGQYPGQAQVPGQGTARYPGGTAQFPGGTAQFPGGTAQFPGAAGQPAAGATPMAGQFGAGKASVPIPGQAAPMAGQFGQGKASVPIPTPTAYQPVTRYESNDGYPGYSGGGSGNGVASSSSGMSRRSMALLSGLGVLIVVLLVVVLIRVNSDDGPDPTTAAGVATSAATTTPKTKPTKKQAAPPPAPTHETTEPTPEQTQDDNGDDQNNDGSADAVSSDNGNVCVEMPQNAAPLDKAKAEDCNGQSTQSWTYTSWFGLQQGDMCLDMGPDNEKPGENRTRVFPCNQTNTQQFKQNADGKVYNPGTGLCLTIGDDDDGAGIGMVDCDGAQVWHLPQRQG